MIFFYQVFGFFLDRVFNLPISLKRTGLKETVCRVRRTWFIKTKPEQDTKLIRATVNFV